MSWPDGQKRKKKRERLYEKECLDFTLLTFRTNETKSLLHFKFKSIRNNYCEVEESKIPKISKHKMWMSETIDSGNGNKIIKFSFK